MNGKTTLDEDVYYKKTISFNFWRHKLLFKTSQELFSSDDIDLGTKFLLRTIVEGDYGEFKKILDLGCGYGPIGLTIKSLNGISLLHLVDKDALAIEYSRQNAELNGFNGVKVYSSLGYDDVKEGDFDLIVSNIPGKAGENAIASFLREAVYCLSPNGLVAVVVVNALEDYVTEVLEKTPGVDIVVKRSRTGHVVYHYRFNVGPGQRPEGSTFERGIYRRNDANFNYKGLKYDMHTVYGLSEFDTLSYGTEMTLEIMNGIGKTEIRNALVVNPGQGHVPVYLWKLFSAQNMVLADRDLLALRASSQNLSINGFPNENLRCFHQVGFGLIQGETADIVVIMLKEEGVSADIQMLLQAVKLLSKNGIMLISASSTAITRLVDAIPNNRQLVIRTRERKRGLSVIVLQRVLQSA